MRFQVFIKLEIVLSALTAYDYLFYIYRLRCEILNLLHSIVAFNIFDLCHIFCFFPLLSPYLSCSV